MDSYYEKLLAHRDSENTGNIQYLKEHLYNTAYYARLMGNSIGLNSLCTLLGLMHDFGKSSRDWQGYVNGDIKHGGDHSTMGGYYVQCYLYNHVIEALTLSKEDARSYEKYSRFIIYPILAHHGLYDCIKVDGSSIVDWTEERLHEAENKAVTHPEFVEFIKVLNQWCIEWFQVSLIELYQKGYVEFLAWKTNIKKLAGKNISHGKQQQAFDFYLGSMARLLLSILKEADVYDSSNWNRAEKQHIYDGDETLDIWKNMSANVEKIYAGYHEDKAVSALNSIRTAMADEAYAAADCTAFGCFTLPMPVGAGKTMTALRYALHHGIRFRDRRILYVTAYLSVLEQNADDIISVIGEKHVLEHHSNVIEDESAGNTDNDEEYNKKNYIKENWESPFILTTLVQLSNTLFKGQSANLRRFSKLIHSVIIIDEIQSLPVETLYLYNLMMNFLTHCMGVTIIHCTATPPDLQNGDVLEYPCLYGGECAEAAYTKGQLVSQHLIDNVVFDRVRFQSLMGKNFERVLDYRELVCHMMGQLQSERSILVIVNTRRAVKLIYDAICAVLDAAGMDGDCYYLTTNLCAAHRLERIDLIKKELKKIRTGQRTNPLICISTKIIEAGVNADFDVVYRSVTSIDSVLQASGRCNREGKRIDKGKVFLFLCKEERIDKITTFRLEQDAAKEALRKEYPAGAEGMQNLDVQKCLSTYYSRLYQKNMQTLAFPVEMSNGRESILDWLSSNALRVTQYNQCIHPEWCHDAQKIKKMTLTTFYLRQSFQMAAKRYELIGNTGHAIIVQYKNKDLINALFEAMESDDLPVIKGILRKLQRYTVSVYHVEDYESHIQPISDLGIYLLDEDSYNEEVGLEKGDMSDLIF